jgi:hypothetical protein
MLGRSQGSAKMSHEVAVSGGASLTNDFCDIDELAEKRR